MCRRSLSPINIYTCVIHQSMSRPNHRPPPSIPPRYLPPRAVRTPNDGSRRWNDNDGSSGRSPTLRTAALILRRASGRRLMREWSVRVLEAAAAPIEEHQSDWAYSRPIVILEKGFSLSP